MYIKITNKSSNVNRLFLEKLGVSTKRDNSDTIGQFGSGSKFAPIAALRNGWEWITTGSDDLGDYRMEYVVVEEGGLECIAFDYGDYKKESSFTVDAGVLSWEDAFQIFREAFSNALDAYTEFGDEYEVLLTDEITNDEGWFSVYLTAAPELVAIYENLDKFFPITRPVVATTGYGNFYEPYDNETVNFYLKNVQVFDGWPTATEKYEGHMFDYGFRSITLNEERRVRDAYEVTRAFFNMLSTLKSTDESHMTVAKKLIANIHKNVVEWSAYSANMYSSYNKIDSAIYCAFYMRYSEDTVIINNDQKLLKSSLIARNKNVVLIENENVYMILAEVGVTTGPDVMGDEADFDFVELGAAKLRGFAEAFDMVKDYDPRIQDYILRFFEPRENQHQLMGQAAIGKNAIYINTNIIHNLSDTVATLVHELDHHVTGFRDADALEFRGAADDRIGDLVVSNYKINQMYLSLAQKKAAG